MCWYGSAVAWFPGHSLTENMYPYTCTDPHSHWSCSAGYQAELIIVENLFMELVDRTVREDLARSSAEGLGYGGGGGHT